MPNIVESLVSVVGALNAATTRYLVAGGLAVNAHGYTRATHDIDLVIQLDSDNVEGALSALEKLGYRPLAPVPMKDFSKSEVRSKWIAEKGLAVFGLVSAEHPQAPVDVFVTEPFGFDGEYEDALCDEIAPGVPIRFVSLNTLIAMKKQVGRPKDLDDIENLSLAR